MIDIHGGVGRPPVPAGGNGCWVCAVVGGNGGGAGCSPRSWSLSQCFYRLCISAMDLSLSGESGRGVCMASPCSLRFSWAPQQPQQLFEGHWIPFSGNGEEERVGMACNGVWGLLISQAAKLVGLVGKEQGLAKRCGGSWWWDGLRWWPWRSIRRPIEGGRVVEPCGVAGAAER